MTPRRVYRSSTNKLLFGVAGGLGEYFAVDPVLVRVGFLFLCIVSAGGAILFYLLLAIVIPRGEATSAGTLDDASRIYGNGLPRPNQLAHDCYTCSGCTDFLRPADSSRPCSFIQVFWLSRRLTGILINRTRTW